MNVSAQPMDAMHLASSGLWPSSSSHTQVLVDPRKAGRHGSRQMGNKTAGRQGAAGSRHSDFLEVSFSPFLISLSWFYQYPINTSSVF